MPAYELKLISEREKLGSDGKFEITRVMDCYPWSARGSAYADLVGGVVLVGTRLVRTLPARHPNFPWTFVNEIDTAPFDESDFLTHAANQNVLTVGASYSGPARMTVVYRPFDFDEDDADQSEQQPQEQQEIEIASWQWEFSGRNLTLPNQALCWEYLSGDDSGSGGAGGPLLWNQNIAATKTIPQIQMVMTRHLCLRKPTTAILQNLGRLNKSAFSVGFDTYPPQTLRFDSARASRRLTTTGLKFYEISYTFACMPLWDRIDETEEVDGEDVWKNGWVTWNRLFDPVGAAPGGVGAKLPLWRKVRWVNEAGRGIYLLDEDAPSQTFGGRTVKGYNLLFHPSAA